MINGFGEVWRSEGIGLMSDVNDVRLCVFVSRFDRGGGDSRESLGFSQAFSLVADMRPCECLVIWLNICCLQY